MPRMVPQELVDRLLTWSDEATSIRDLAKRAGVSRSHAQRVLERYRRAQRPMDPAREAAGTEPLPVGHPLSWGAISSRPMLPAW